MNKIEITERIKNAMEKNKERSQNQLNYIANVKQLCLLSEALGCSLHIGKYVEFGEDLETSVVDYDIMNSYIHGVLGLLKINTPVFVDVATLYTQDNFSMVECLAAIATLALYAVDCCDLTTVNKTVFQTVDSLCIEIESLSRKLKECVIRNQ